MLRNESGVIGARIGKVNGVKYVFTHRNPANGNVWADSQVNNDNFQGCWFPAEWVEWE